MTEPQAKEWFLMLLNLVTSEGSCGEDHQGSRRTRELHNGVGRNGADSKVHRRTNALHKAYGRNDLDAIARGRSDKLSKAPKRCDVQGRPRPWHSAEAERHPMSTQKLILFVTRIFRHGHEQRVTCGHHMGIDIGQGHLWSLKWTLAWMKAGCWCFL